MAYGRPINGSEKYEILVFLMCLNRSLYRIEDLYTIVYVFADSLQICRQPLVMASYPRASLTSRLLGILLKDGPFTSPSVAFSLKSFLLGLYISSRIVIKYYKDKQKLVQYLQLTFLLLQILVDYHQNIMT
jgi:hypothetical protein